MEDYLVHYDVKEEYHFDPNIKPCYEGEGELEDDF